MPRILILLLTLACLAAPARADDDRRFVGVTPLDVAREADRAVARVAALEGLGGVLVSTSPIAWGSIEPAPGRRGAPSYRWKALDEAVLVWQLAGLDPVLVLSPRSAKGGLPADKSAWHAAVRGVLDPVEAVGALRGATGATPPRPALWSRWERFVRDVVERYDGDGSKDMPGLRRPIRHVQPLAGIDAAWWLGDEEQLLRLMHHAIEGARNASEDCRVLAPTIDMRATGHAPFPDRREWDFRVNRLAPSSSQALPRLEVQRHFALARRILGMPRLFDILCQAGSTHLADDVANLTFLRRTLDAGGGSAKGLWLLDNPMRKLGDARAPGAVAPKRDERRLRQRWLPAALNPRHPQHGRAREWMRRGQAYDLVRGVCRARAAGADAVLFFAPFDALPEDHPRRGPCRGQGLLEACPGKTAPQPTPAWYALQQAVRHLGGHRGAGETPIGAPGQSVIFQFDREQERPWVAVLLLDPRLSWAGEPAAPLPLRDVLVTLPSGSYTLEWIRTGPAEPRRREVVSDGSLTLQLGPEPVYVIPKR